ncbi:expressed unknown protein [Seminavis robusta]|uniref:Uncharacterized protein n=1 Tax=Seminavis robusta TaxID=568900 RepID=A0A9N8H3M9_9STRA|nr:expressed unknown protein [Seminavis robusta]|eukprot:Sro64_g036520.1 n/a (577) ;mRNA; r:132629-134359
MESLVPTDSIKANKLEDARDKLRFWAIRDASVVLGILKAHPLLAQETFFCGCVCNGKKGQSLSPLASLIALQAPLDIIQQVLELYPDAALGKCESRQSTTSAASGDPCLPLHVAAATSGPNSFSSVQFLAQRFPQTVSIPDASGNLPLHHALQSLFEHSTLETIQCLVELYPKSVLQKNKNGETPLQFAIENAYEDPIIDYLASQLPSRQQEFSFGNCLILNIDRCHALTRLLPYLTSLTCRPTQWTWEGMDHLLTTLVKSSSTSRVQKLVLEWIPRAFFTSNHRMGQHLRDLLRSNNNNNNTLLDLRIQVKNAWFDKNRNSDILCLETLRGILQSAVLPPEFRFSLSLHSFQLYKDTLEQFIQKAQPKRLSLNCCTIFESASVIASNYAVPAATGTATRDVMSLERLELVQTRMSNTIFQALLATIRQMQHLKHLKLIFRRTEDFGDVRGLLDMTDFVADMLPRLETLTVEGLFVAPKLLAQFATTQQKSATIQTNCYMEYIQYGKMCRSLQYYTALKHFGQSLHTYSAGGVASKTNFLQVMKDLDEFEDIQEVQVKDQIRYGLLNEWCPSLWSS